MSAEVRTYAPIDPDEGRAHYQVTERILDHLDERGLLGPMTPMMRHEVAVGVRDIRSVLL